jgi:hypothetical protein
MTRIMSSATWRLIGVALVLIVFGGIVAALSLRNKSDVKRPFHTASDDLRVRRAYEIARTKPDILKRIPCTCGCMRRHGHASNLDCFKTAHGETCWQCVAIAITVDEHLKKGASTDWIIRYVNNVYTFQITN